MGSMPIRKGNVSDFPFLGHSISKQWSVLSRRKPGLLITAEWAGVPEAKL